jgi:hypothetical protein
MFWWGDQTKAWVAASAVGAAFGATYSLSSGQVGPFFAYNAFPFQGSTYWIAQHYQLSGPNQFPSTTTISGSGSTFPQTFTWATSSIRPVASVPGPLPVLGVAAAFGFSRKLRKRIKNSAKPVSSSYTI